MFLSRVEFEPSKPDIHRPWKIHGAIEDASPRPADGSERGRRLWRIDYLNGLPVLLIVSEELPDLAAMQLQFGMAGKKPETREYGPFLARIEAGQRWAFRLTANPVKSEFTKDADGNVKRGTVRGLTTSGQKPWLMERAEGLGFKLEPGSFDVMSDEMLMFRKGNSTKTVSIRSVTFEGVLTVTDADKLRDALKNGIGRGKAYGCGLMTLARDTH